MHEQEDWLRDRDLTIAEEQAWGVLERRLVAEGVTGVDEILAYDVERMRGRGMRATTDSIVALVLGIGFVVIGLRLIGLPTTAIVVVGASLGLGLVLTTTLVRVLGLAHKVSSN